VRPLSLFLVFVTAKVLVLAGRDVPVSPWTPLAYFWQDALVAVVLAGPDWLLRRRPWAAWGLYALAAGYAALNVPLGCLLSTPLTWPLLRATGGTIADSIGHHVTAPNLLRIGVVVGVAALLPRLLRPVVATPRRCLILWGAAVVMLLLGPIAATRLATHGLHRNALAALVTSALPHVLAADTAGDWSVSPLGGVPGEDLSHLRGRAAGRNVVVVHLESTGARYLKPYGAAEDPMPHLTELSRRALLFENACTTYPETIRSFFATQCSIFPALDTQAEDYEPAHAPALAGLLAKHGYRTGLFHSGRFRYLGMEEALRQRGYQTREDAGDIGGRRESSFGIDEASTVRRMLAWIDERPAEPFLLTYLPIAGHHPYDAPGPRPFPDDAEIDRYRNALNYADDSLADLLRGLRERGLENRTLFVICGDHGEAFGQHEGNYGHTLFLYEENVRVPLLIAAPGVIEDSLRVRRVASLVALAPTVLDLLGLPIPGEYQGRSLLSGEPRMALFCTDYSLGLVGLRDGRWKMIHEIDSGRSQLFDVEADPDETRDVSATMSERTAVYREHLLRWAAAQKYRLKRKP
jgi:arylsulfatase A-like enzyme